MKSSLTQVATQSTDKEVDWIYSVKFGCHPKQNLIRIIEENIL